MDESQDGLLSEEELFLGPNFRRETSFRVAKGSTQRLTGKKRPGGVGNLTLVSIENEFLSKHLALCCRLAVIEFDEMRCCRQRS